MDRRNFIELLKQNIAIDEHEREVTHEEIRYFPRVVENDFLSACPFPLKTFVQLHGAQEVGLYSLFTVEPQQCQNHETFKMLNYYTIVCRYCGRPKSGEPKKERETDLKLRVRLL